MKALTVMQPWASLLIWGEKRLETRSWFTTYRGPLAIHAGKGMPANVMAKLKEEWLDREGMFWAALHRHGIAAPTALPRGAVLGTCQLVDCVPVEQIQVVADAGLLLTRGDGRRLISWQELAFGDYSPGRYAWVLERPRVFDEPIPARGALGLWEWDERHAV